MKFIGKYVVDKVDCILKWTSFSQQQKDLKNFE
jgi:hypothetical protein